MKVTLSFAVLLVAVLCDRTFGDTFGSGANAFDIEFVTIGNPGNVPDTTGDPNPVGSVPYEYRIGKYEISEDMFLKATNLFPGMLRGPNKPVTSINWYGAAGFVNWLNTTSGSPPAYKFLNNSIYLETAFQLWNPSDSGYDPANPFRNKLAKYFLPSIDEWYKAAYYDPATNVYYDYPTGSNTQPTSVVSGVMPGTAVFGHRPEQRPADFYEAGGLSPYGTMAQGGNVFEWTETAHLRRNDTKSSDRLVRGGDWKNGFSMKASVSGHAPPNTSFFSDVGFRVGSVAIPEPSAIVLATSAVSFLSIRRARLR